MRDVQECYTYDSPSPVAPMYRVARCILELSIELEYGILFSFERDDRVEGLSFEIGTWRRRFEEGEIRYMDCFRIVCLEVATKSENDGGYEETEIERVNGIRKQEMDAKNFPGAGDHGRLAPEATSKRCCRYSVTPRNPRD